MDLNNITLYIMVSHKITEVHNSPDCTSLRGQYLMPVIIDLKGIMFSAVSASCEAKQNNTLFLATYTLNLKPNGT